MAACGLLVVDDDPLVLAAMQRVLVHRFSLLLAAECSGAQLLAAKHRPRIAFIDLRLGDGSGIELVRWLRTSISNISIAVMSGGLTVEATTAVVRAGADIVAAKPVTPGELLRRLAQPQTDPPIRTPTLARAERGHLERVVADCNGNISEAARRLGMFRASLQRKLRRTAPPF
ncbi:MAG TPA: response regulator [Kofleriaceae bacterium]